MYILHTSLRYQYISSASIDEGGRIVHAFGTKNLRLNRCVYSPIDMNNSDNRTIFLKALGVRSEDIYTVGQIHGDNVFMAKNDTLSIRGDMVKADAIITEKKGLPIGVITADCIPVLILDREGRAVSAVHAGREGVIKNIAGKAVDKILSATGVTSPKNLTALIGPGIGRCCYSVSCEQAQRIKDYLFCHNSIISKIGGKIHVDLKKAVHLQLVRSGLSENNIFSVNICTSCYADYFFSYRRSRGTPQRMISFVMIK